MIDDSQRPSTSRSTDAPLVDKTHLLRFALWLAVGFGLAEAALVAVAAFGLGRFMHVSPQLIWQAPVSFAIVFAALAGLLMLPWRRLTAPLRLRLLAFGCAFIGCISILMMASQLSRTAVLILAAGVAVQLSYFAVRLQPRLQRIVRATFVPAVAAVALLGIGLNGAWWLAELRSPRTAAEGSASPNVLLIIWDTVRAANLSLYGYDRATTPNLDRIASRGVVLDNAFSPAPWTLPSHAALFTGADPRQGNADWTQPMRDDRTTIAEVLRDRGYRTAGFVANMYYAGRESGLDRGFARYEDFPLLTLQQLVRSTTLGRRIIRSERLVELFDYDPSMELKDARAITDAALDWMQRDADRPFFAFLNYLDAHSPYDPPAPYAQRFGSLPREQKLNFGTGRALETLELQAEIDAYDGGIAYMDAELGRMLAELERVGRLENTIIIVTSDHGEEFGEHGVYLHGNSLYDRSLHVPLVIVPPQMTDGVRRDEWVPLRDVPATILALTGTAGNSFPGRALITSASADSSAAPHDTIVASVSRRPGVLASYPAAKGRIIAVMADQWKFIRYGDGREELFDLRADRDERHDRLATAPADIVKVLRARASAADKMGAE